MAFANTNDYLVGRKPTVFPAGSENVTVRYEIDLLAADLTLNNTGEIGILPAGCVPVALYVDADDLDTGTPALLTSVGLQNDLGTDLSSVWGSGITTGQAAGASAVVSSALLRQAVAGVDRKIGVKVTTAPATPAAGKYAITLVYRAV